MTFEHRHRVGESEIDWLGHASNVAFVQWLQDAAIGHSAAVGWSPERYRAYGAGFVVRGHRVEYRGSARLGDELRITTWIADTSGCRSLRRYEIRRGDGELLAKAETLWAFVDLAKGSPRRIPDEILAAFRVPTPSGETSILRTERSRWMLWES